MGQGPKLSTRLAIAIVGLVVLTAATVGYLGYRNIAAVAVARTLMRLDANAHALAADLANIVRSARADVQGFRRVIGLEELISLSRDPSLGQAGGQTLAQWRARIADRFAAELEAKPDYRVLRIIGVADGGREIIRAERLEDGRVRVVPDAELQRKGERDFLQQGLEAPSGALLLSPVELNQDYGAIITPHIPVIRASTPLYAADGTLFGLLIANVDLRAPFARLKDATNPNAVVYVVNDRGDYLMHPDPSRRFGFEFGTPFRIQDDFPSLAPAISTGRQQPELAEARDGQRYGLALAQMRVFDYAPMAVVEAVKEQQIVGIALTAFRESSLLGGLIAVAGAVLLAIALARTMTRPLSQMTAAVAGYSGDAPLAMPRVSSGEIGVLARAFEKMIQEVSAKNAAIRHEKDLSESIMTTMAECVVLIDLTGEVIYDNRANRDLLAELDMAAPNWRDLYDLYAPDGATQLSREQWPSARSLRGETIDNYEIVCKRRDTGKTVHLAGSARPLKDSTGTQTGAVVVFRDVTASRQTERQLQQAQKLEAIGQLTGGIAHDFNNLLTVITGTTEILVEELADRPHLANLAKMIGHAGDRGAELTGHLLAFARRQPLQPRNVDVNAAVIDATRLLRPALGEQIEIEATLEDGAEPALVDPSQLSAALLNLAVNARDAMPHGGKLLLETGNVVLDDSYAQANPEVRPGPYVMIAISDTGTGIPAAIRDQVFEPFFTTKEVGKGTGLGLSMVYGFVKQSGGHIKIYSEEGHGTTIRLYLPRADAAAETAAAGVAITGGSETILVVEDDEMVRSFLVAQLRNLGYTTVTANSGPAALALLDQGVSFDLLFTDVIMPGGINGRQLAEAIARRRPVRVLYTSGYTENAIVHHGRLDAGVLLLPKPYRKADLARMVRAALASDPVSVPLADPRNAAAGSTSDVPPKSPGRPWPNTGRAAGA